MTSEAERAGAILTIDLGSIVANYRSLRDRVAPAECAAVVKADAYGLGAGRVAPVLRDAGCRTFFVASIDEGIAVRRVLDERDREQGGDGSIGTESAVYVLNGLFPRAPGLFAEHRLRPVLNSLGEIDAWAAFARGTAPAAAAAIHVDTGMSRLGLPGNELAILRDDPSRLDGFRPTHVHQPPGVRRRTRPSAQRPSTGGLRGGAGIAAARPRIAGEFFRHLPGTRVSRRPGPAGMRPLWRLSGSRPAQPHAASCSPARENPASA